jgi:hypothetical protein
MGGQVRAGGPVGGGGEAVGSAGSTRTVYAQKGSSGSGNLSARPASFNAGGTAPHRGQSAAVVIDWESRPGAGSVPTHFIPPPAVQTHCIEDGEEANAKGATPSAKVTRTKQARIQRAIERKLHRRIRLRV